MSVQSDIDNILGPAWKEANEGMKPAPDNQVDGITKGLEGVAAVLVAQTAAIRELARVLDKLADSSSQGERWR